MLSILPASTLRRKVSSDLSLDFLSLAAADAHSNAVAAIGEWDKRTDFLRLYQAVHVGLRLRDLGIRHVHAHFAGLAARTAFWIAKFFDIGFSFTAHANDIFAPRQFEIGLDRLVDPARAVVTVTDYGANFLKERFPKAAERICRIYNGVDLTRVKTEPRLPAEFRERYSIPSDRAIVTQVSWIIPEKGIADFLETAIKSVLAAGVRTADIAGGKRAISTTAMANAVLRQLETQRN